MPVFTAMLWGAEEKEAVESGVVPGLQQELRSREPHHQYTNQPPQVTFLLLAPNSLYRSP